MIVASFLSKDLLLDWRMGERYFMSKLVDGDFASNHGGWGFSSSTGVDPQVTILLALLIHHFDHPIAVYSRVEPIAAE
jgi:deoxyribodipyrimidine photolyase